MGILLKTVRVKGFRGIKNLEVNLEQVTVLTGMNNAGKTSFLKALQIALGSRQFISQDDFYILGNNRESEIIVDLKIIPVNERFERVSDFDENWEILLTDDRIKQELNGDSAILVRTIITYDSSSSTYKTKQYILTYWADFLNGTTHWYESNNGTEKSFFFDQIPFFYTNAQRDIIEDIKLRGSYLGRMISKITYENEAIREIEKQIAALNTTAVSSSDILSKLSETLSELNTAMGTSSSAVEITPFTKKIRDLNKGLSIYYNDNNESFSMEYHGMGTRSWSSLLTLKSLVSVLETSSGEEPFFPILAVEEPEAYLHPNAQKNLYTQISNISGQKIISTHSPYIAASAALKEIRNLYKKDDNITCGFIDTSLIDEEQQRKIRRQVINTRGELFFSKAIVFFEGETEEQAFPIFASSYFGKTANEMSIDFVGVGGFRNFLHFARVAEGLKIPWFIFSDAENTSDKPVMTEVTRQFTDSCCSRSQNEVLFFVDEGCDYEQQLLNDSYQDEIKNAIRIMELANCRNENHRISKTISVNEDLAGYSDEALYKKMTESKTKFGPAVAQAIVDSEKMLPPKVVALFEAINNVM